ncbi:MAG: hypothetical protein ACJ79E_05415 [Anaeromyxobacteraceae bacterium]
MRLLRAPAASALAFAVALTCGGCRGQADADARERAFAAGRDPASAAFDFEKPLAALAIPAEDAASRLGSFAWEAKVSWSAAKPGASAVRATEHHRVRQLASGEFEAEADLDPGTGPGAETGKQVVFTGGVTYAHAKWAPFRERPADRGRDARRFRDDSFGAAAAVAALLGPSLRATPAGEATVLGRSARRYALSFAAAPPSAPPMPPEGLPDGGYDADTRRHLDFLDGRLPTAAQGQLVLDARSGVPLAVELTAAFAQRSDPQLEVKVELSAAMTTLGSRVAAVAAPKGALPDDRKPKGVARALEAAGLAKRRAPAAEDGGEDEERGDDAPAE